MILSMVLPVTVGIISIVVVIIVVSMINKKNKKKISDLELSNSKSNK